MTYGGLPLTLSIRSPEQKAAYLIGLFKEVYLTDVVERNHLTKSQELEDLVSVLASSIGALTNPSKIEATFRSVLHSRLDARNLTIFMLFSMFCLGTLALMNDFGTALIFFVTH